MVRISGGNLLGTQVPVLHLTTTHTPTPAHTHTQAHTHIFSVSGAGLILFIAWKTLITALSFGLFKYCVSFKVKVTILHCLPKAEMVSLDSIKLASHK